VQAVAAGRHRHRGEPKRYERLAQEERRLHHRRERSLVRVEVEEDDVRAVGQVDAGRPDVQVDHPAVDEPVLP
jgi:hypothetical protein